MANATAALAKTTAERLLRMTRSSETLSAATTYYKHALIGVDSTGYYCKGDDTQAWLLAGVAYPREGNIRLPAGTAGDGTIDLDVFRPEAVALDIASVAVTDIGKTVYASYDQTGTLDPSGLTYANVVGQVIDVLASGIALVTLAYDGIGAHKRLGAAKFIAATGAQTLSKFDLGKTIFLPNTAALALTLPAVADCPAGTTLTFVKTTSAAFAVTLTGNAAETIDGSNTLATIDAQYDTAQIVSTGSAWVVTYRDIA